jgi:hypothetical protein
MEEIEKSIIKSINTDMASNLSQETQKTIAPFLPTTELDQIIDTNHIHQWLQEKITGVEQRQALLIKKLDEAGVTDIYIRVQGIYEDFGRQAAQDADIKNSNDLRDIFNNLNNYLLEGMPCDRVNQVIEDSTLTLSWMTTRCVHTINWSTAGIPVEVYYNFRASFIEGFVTAINPTLKYKYTNVEQQLHVINKENLNENY